MVIYWGATLEAEISKIFTTKRSGDKEALTWTWIVHRWWWWFSASCQHFDTSIGRRKKFSLVHTLSTRSRTVSKTLFCLVIFYSSLSDNFIGKICSIEFLKYLIEFVVSVVDRETANFSSKFSPSKTFATYEPTTLEPYLRGSTRSRKNKNSAELG